MRQLRVRRIKREWNETLKATRFFLLFAQTNEVIDAILGRFDVAVEHRRIRLQTGGVTFPLKFEPALRVAFVRADHGACRLAKDLCAAARARIESRCDQLLN